MWRLCMAGSIIIISDLMARAVHGVLTGVVGEHMKEGWQQLGNWYCACIVCNGAQRRVDHVAWKVLILV